MHKSPGSLARPTAVTVRCPGTMRSLLGWRGAEEAEQEAGCSGGP